MSLQDKIFDIINKEIKHSLLIEML